MYLDTKKLNEKLNNHQKLLSMVSDKVLPIKQTLIDDVKDMKRIIEISNKQNKEK